MSEQQIIENDITKEKNKNEEDQNKKEEEINNENNKENNQIPQGKILFI